MKTLTKLSTTFSKDMVPEAHAVPGEVVEFAAVDCFNMQIVSEEAMPEIDDDQTNPVTGPLYVDGARPGDTLAVQILDIQLEDHGWVCSVPKLGIVDHEPRIRRIEIKDGCCWYKELHWPVDTMIGTIGCPVPDRDYPAHYVFAGGGNMDSRRVTKGTILYVPVRVPGALLAMGDMHATMGDGEIAGTGVEVGGKIVCRVGLIKNFKLNWPVTETKRAYYVNTCGKTCDEAIEAGYREMHRLLIKAYGWDATDALMYMTMQGFVEASQACLNPNGGGNSFRVGTPKVLAKARLIPEADFGGAGTVV